MIGGQPVVIVYFLGATSSRGLSRNNRRLHIHQLRPNSSLLQTLQLKSFGFSIFAVILASLYMRPLFFIVIIWVLHTSPPIPFFMQEPNTLRSTSISCATEFKINPCMLLLSLVKTSLQTSLQNLFQ